MIILITGKTRGLFPMYPDGVGYIGNEPCGL